MNNVDTMRVTRSLAMSSEVTGAMICIRGEMAGQMLPLPCDKKMLIGRDSAICSYVLSDIKVSRKHLEISYIGTINQYLVVDFSKNGTFLGDGTRLKTNKEYYLPPMTELRLGSSDNIYKLR